MQLNPFLYKKLFLFSPRDMVRLPLYFLYKESPFFPSAFSLKILSKGFFSSSISNFLKKDETLNPLDEKGDSNHYINIFFENIV